MAARLTRRIAAKRDIGMLRDNDEEEQHDRARARLAATLADAALRPKKFERQPSLADGFIRQFENALAASAVSTRTAAA
ncbi:hypothetical protein [Nocardioides pakistanensis]